MPFDTVGEGGGGGVDWKNDLLAMFGVLFCLFVFCNRWIHNVI